MEGRRACEMHGYIECERFKLGCAYTIAFKYKKHDADNLTVLLLCTTITNNTY